MPAGEAEYIYYGGASLPAPPYCCNEAQFMSLPCAGDGAAIQNFVDRTLNAATCPGRYSILSRYVFLAVMAAADTGSVTPPFSGQGTMAETDIGFWIPVTDTRQPFSIFWYPAYLFVDNWLAVVGGREVWGFPKAWATIEASSGDPRDGAIAVSTLAVKKLEPSARATMAEIFRLTPGASAAAGGEPVGDEGLTRAIARLLAGDLFLELMGVMARLLEAGGTGLPGAPMILLKQVRDAASPATASYRSVITADTTITAVIGSPSLKGEHCLTLNDFASQPIAADLGLRVGDQTLPFALCATIDFTLGLGTPVAPD
jgi:hypothetical protein